MISAVDAASPHYTRLWAMDLHRDRRPTPKQRRNAITTKRMAECRRRARGLSYGMPMQKYWKAPVYADVNLTVKEVAVCADI